MTGDDEAIPPLAGFTVGITADRRWEEQAELLRRRGAAVVHGPTIRTLPLGPEVALRDATQQVIEEPPDYVIANTGIGMRAWFNAAESWGIGEALIGALSDARVYSRGPKASGAVHAVGLDVVNRAGSERLEEVLEALLRNPLDGSVIAFQLHGDESPGVTSALRAAGAKVVEVPVYEWTMPDDHRPAVRLIESVISGKVHAVTFTSAPAVHNLFRIARDQETTEALRQALNGSVVAVCVGSVCAEAATESGITDPVVPDRFRLGPMIRTLTSTLAGTTVRCRVLEHLLSIQGTAVFIDGDRIDLTDKEAAVLAVLVKRAGTVVARPTLLAAVWGAGADEHAMEVAVGRLRRRLGDVGAAIESIRRRGYILRAEVTIVERDPNELDAEPETAALA